MKKKIKDIIIREDLYPRINKDLNKIKEYSENLKNLPPIIITHRNILVDGLHRIEAHKFKKQKEINIKVEKLESDNEIFLRAIELNSTHGLQLSQKDKQSLAIKLYDGKNFQRLIKSLSVSERTFRNWTQNKRKQLEEERNDRILSLYLKCWTQQEIANEVGIEQKTISNILTNIRNNGNFAEITNFKPFLYNIWNISKINNSTQHFGNVPIEFTENLLYYYTEPFDVVYDPFAGGGTTIDACKKWLRRYYISDRVPISLREKEIKEWDIKDGLPKDLPNNIKLVFLDPPYWKQSENQYSKDKEDLANMTLEKFYDSIVTFVKNVKKKLAKNGKIALIIQPTQWKNNNIRIDHSFDIAEKLKKLGFEIEQRIICPYSTEQYNAQMVEKAKKDKICLQTYRDLIVFKKVFLR